MSARKWGNAAPAAGSASAEIDAIMAALVAKGVLTEAEIEAARPKTPAPASGDGKPPVA